jgi:hypothetical protein
MADLFVQFLLPMFASFLFGLKVIRSMRKLKQDLKEQAAKDAIIEKEKAEKVEKERLTHMEAACAALKEREKQSKQAKKRYVMLVWASGMCCCANVVFRILSLFYKHFHFLSFLLIESLKKPSKEKKSPTPIDHDYVSDDETMSESSTPVEDNEEPEDIQMVRISTPRWEDNPNYQQGNKKKKGKHEPKGWWMVDTFWDSKQYTAKQREQAYPSSITDVYKDNPSLVKSLLKNEAGLPNGFKEIVEKIIGKKNATKMSPTKTKKGKNGSKSRTPANKSTETANVAIATVTNNDINNSDNGTIITALADSLPKNDDSNGDKANNASKNGVKGAKTPTTTSMDDDESGPTNCTAV